MTIMKKLNLLTVTIVMAVVFYYSKIFEPFFVWRIPFGAVRIPVLYWSVFLAYSFLFLAREKDGLKGRITHIISLGIALDLFRAFMQSQAYRIITNYFFEASIYKVYYNAVYYAGMAAAGFLLAYIVRRVFFSKAERSWRAEYVLMPFAAVFTAGIAALIQVDPASCAVSIAFAVLFGLLPGLEKIARYIRKGWQSLLGWALGHERTMLLIFFLAAIGVRLIYLLRTMSQPDYVATGADGALFDSHAWNIAFGSAPVTQAYTAGYFVFLAGLYKVFGHNYFAACFVQVIMGGFVCLFIYEIIKELTGDKLVSYLGLFLATVNYSLVFSSISIGHQALDCFLLSFIAVVFIRYLRENDKFRAVITLTVCALASGYAIAARESDLFVVGALPIFILARRINEKKIARGITEIVFFTALVMLPIVPFLVRNFNNLGVAYPVKYSDAALFPAEHTFSPEGSGNLKLIELGINPFTDPKGSLVAFLRQPGASSAALADSVGSKFTSLFLDQTYGTFDMLFLIRRSWFYIAAWLYAFFITVFGVGYMLFVLHRDNRMPVYLILAFILMKTLPHLLISARFGLRPPIDVFLLIAFSIGAMRIFSIDGKDTVYQR